MASELHLDLFQNNRCSGMISIMGAMENKESETSFKLLCRAGQPRTSTDMNL